MDEIEALFENLERIAGDPVFDKLMSDIKEMNEYLQVDPCNYSEAGDIVQGLRQQITEAHLVDAPLKVTGGVYIQELAEGFDPYAELESDSRTDFIAQDMQLRGFTILTDEYAAPQIYMRATTLIENTDDDFDDDEDNEDIEDIVGCVIPMNGEATVVYEGMSAARSAAWLEMTQPEMKEELDYRIANCDSETEAVLALADMKFAVNGFDEEQISELKSHLRLYTASLAEFEKHALYVAELIGPAGIYNPSTNTNEIHTITSQDETFLAIDSIDYALNSYETQLEPIIRAILVGGKKREDHIAYIPPKTFDSLTSLREERRQTIRDRKAQQ